jgi:SAM-dependent methyltransferase
VIGIDASESVIRDATATAEAVPNVTFQTGDVYTLDFPDDSFDIVHAHQVLQHLADPVAALREMRRVCAPDGLVAARDSDYAAMTWFPEVPEMDEWMALYHAIARGNGAEPDAGRRLVSWGRAAGFAEVTASASAWCFADPTDRDWWAGSWADRVTMSTLASQAIDRDLASREDLNRISAAWRRWATHEDAWFAVVHGEIRCRG